ncbi:putative bifunctional diguanylate cyclase/phosphodiesterase [Paenibacillus sp. SYP-B4298]|uniref:putative bifunctional diguanylate cyclase/phosphodiesterase n=1 Tax=Paenibacillus sp. SYP-B4298 TaxID=2996034 RepID=UPI0022DDD996|nr:EAL domain-containing protein [Paenibacillus sp. SYP-B4298]
MSSSSQSIRMMSRSELKTVGAAAAAGASFLLLLLLRRDVYTVFDAESYLMMHIIIKFFSFAMCFSIVFLGAIFFVHTLSRQRLYSAALFLVVGMMELCEALTTWGGLSIPFGEQGEISLYSLVSASGQLVMALGILLIFTREDKQQMAPVRLLLFSSALAGGIALCVLASQAPRMFPLVFGGEGYIMMRETCQLITIVLLILTIFMIMYRNRADKPQALLLIVQGLLFFLFASLQFMISSADGDTDMLAGQLYNLLGYYYLLRGIYYVTLEEPHRRHRQAEERINFLAYHDELTGLSNRRLFQERLGEELVRARSSGKKMAVILLDIDRFKTINDTLGHSFGDQILSAVAGRLQRIVPYPNCVFRMGGDEFTIILPYLRLPEEAIQTAEALMRLFHSPIAIGEADYHITISLGISLYPDDGDSVEQLVKNADVAMYSAKAQRNDFKRFTPQMNERAGERLALENDLRRALEHTQFKMNYQPLVELETGRVVGVEALVRWQHPQRGMIPPGDFIPLSEETGFILPLGEWVLREACRQNKQWQDEGLPKMMMSVNLSMRQFKQYKLVERVAAILRETGLEARYLELEITESMTTEVDYAVETLTRLKALGVRISVDDFGTGYSSLIYLKRLPIDKLKIDRSFVSDVMHDSNDAAIVSTIAAMAKHLKLRITAEGVEDAAQLEFLRRQQCEEAQGYFFGRPMPPTDFAAWLQQHKLV